MTSQNALEVPAPPRSRALAPDLARGAMLLFIALAHAPGVLLGTTPGADPTPHGTAERIYNVFSFSFVHARGLSLFAMMFGYSLVQLYRRQTEITGDPAIARRILLRRNAWLFVFGAVHGVLLFSGDILAAYGVIGTVCTLLLLDRGDRFQRVAVWYVGLSAVSVAVLASLTLIGLIQNPAGDAAVPITQWLTGTGDDYLASVSIRASEWVFTMLTLLAVILMVWPGIWAARHGILENPQKYRRQLRMGAVAGLTIGALGGLPMGLLSAGYLHPDAGTVVFIRPLYETSGFFGSVGFICCFALVAARMNGGRHPVVNAITALGQRSLSGYLFQSVAWLVLGSSYLLDLGGTASPLLTGVGCAIAVWLFTVMCADAMRRKGIRGPAETLLRRLAYRR